MTDEESDQQRCPVCDRSVASVTVVGPDEAIVAPCGHRVTPQALEREE